jgi:hypothetical protein
MLCIRVVYSDQCHIGIVAGSTSMLRIVYCFIAVVTRMAPIVVPRLLAHAGGALFGLVLFTSQSSSGENICRPAIVVESAKFGPVLAKQRVWIGVLSVNAGRCAGASGLFELGFVREKENAPDLQFVEPFTWTAGTMQVSVKFWEDEFVAAYWIHQIAPCACRE